MNEIKRLKVQIKLLKAERDEADRRAGAAERNLAYREESHRKEQWWIEQAKEAAGYHQNVSFDVVWEETLAAAKAYKATLKTS